MNLVALIPYFIQAGVQLAPLVSALVKYLTDQRQLARPDITDADFTALETAIAQLQARIDAE